MAHTIEPARSSRASCKTCKGKIEKGELRFGEEAPNPFMDGEMGYRWHHLKCAAKKKSDILLDTLDEIEIEVPEREELIALAKKAADEKPAPAQRSPFAEYAKTGRSSCIDCKEKIEKGDLRVNVYIEPEMEGGFGKKGFAHPNCSTKFSNGSTEDMIEEIRKNSTGLSEADYEKLEAVMV